MSETTRDFLDLVQSLPDALHGTGTVPQRIAPLVEACAALREAYGPTGSARVLAEGKPLAQRTLDRAPLAVRRLVGDWLVLEAAIETVEFLRREDRVWTIPHPPAEPPDPERTRALLAAGRAVFSREPELCAAAVLLAQDPEADSTPPRDRILALARQGRRWAGTTEFADFLLLRLGPRGRDEQAWVSFCRSARVGRVRHDGHVARARLRFQAGEAAEAAHILLDDIPLEAWMEITTYNALLYTGMSHGTVPLDRLDAALERTASKVLSESVVAGFAAQVRRDAPHWRVALRSKRFPELLERRLPDAFLSALEEVKP